MRAFLEEGCGLILRASYWQGYFGTVNSAEACLFGSRLELELNLALKAFAIGIGFGFALDLRFQLRRKLAVALSFLELSAALFLSRFSSHLRRLQERRAASVLL